MTSTHETPRMTPVERVESARKMCASLGRLRKLSPWLLLLAGGIAVGISVIADAERKPRDLVVAIVTVGVIIGAAFFYVRWQLDRRITIWSQVVRDPAKYDAAMADLKALKG